MTSNFTSDVKPELVARLDKVSLSFQTPAYRAWSLRQQFVDFMRAPLTQMLAQKDRLAVLRDLNLEIHAGDRIGVVGRNGAGKTTMARCLTGTYRPETGEVQRFGNVRAIFDVSVGLYPDLTGRENIQVMIRLLYPQFAHESLRIESEVIAFAGLGDHVDMPFRHYSKGMQVRLGLALMTARPADLIILDEVLDGADRFFQDKMADRIKSFLNQAKAVVFISHSTDQIRQVCNRLIVIEDGRVQFDGGVEKGLSFYYGLQPREGELNV